MDAKKQASLEAGRRRLEDFKKARAAKFGAEASAAVDNQAAVQPAQASISQPLSAQPRPPPPAPQTVRVAASAVTVKPQAATVGVLQPPEPADVPSVAQAADRTDSSTVVRGQTSPASNADLNARLEAALAQV